MPFTTLRGETVLLYGQGLYRYDTLFSAGAFKGSDLLVLAGALSYLLYNAASMAFGAAFNPLFLLYVALSLHVD